MQDPGCASSQDINEDDAVSNECSDGIDNDKDGAVDFPLDPSCEGRDDNETSVCSDGIDNDGDGHIDMDDWGCSSEADESEENSITQCSDGIDNDSDGKIDYGEDPGCYGAEDDNENNIPACSDGIDNDGDGFIDFPEDAHCINSQDDSENPKSGSPVCANGKDDDGDGLIDWQQDRGCRSPLDIREDNPFVECYDGTDNDGDGAIDFPEDPGCSGPADTSEANPVTQCIDHIDNDRDDLTDFPSDLQCEGSLDDDEATGDRCAVLSWVNPDDPSVPVCPQGLPLLNENYPALAYAVGAHPFEFIPDHKYTVDFVLGVLKEYLDKPPLLFLTVDPATFADILTAVKAASGPRTVYAQYREKWLAALVRNKKEAYPWAQDIFETFVDPSTGYPVLRTLLPARDEYEEYTLDELFSNFNAACSSKITTGDMVQQNMPTSNRIGSALQGGNIESLPNICLVSNRTPESFLSKICPDPASALRINTDFLSLGHVDELVKLIPDLYASDPQCRFAVLLSSPRKAYDLLSMNPDGQFFEKVNVSENGITHFSDITNLVCRRRKSQGIDCESHSGFTLTFDSLKNSDIWELLNDRQYYKEWREVNDLVQVKMDEIREQIRQKLAERTGCQNIKFIDIPDLYYGGHASSVFGEPGRTLPRDLNPLHPASANAVLTGTEMVFSDPKNSAFRTYLARMTADLGIQARFIDAFESLNQYRGGMHCGTHKITYCRPAP